MRIDQAGELGEQLALLTHDLAGALEQPPSDGAPEDAKDTLGTVSGGKSLSVGVNG